MTTYEGGNAEGPPGRHPARGARTGAGPRLCDHGSAAGAHRRPGRPAHRHDLPGVAPAGAGRLGAGSLVSGWRAADRKSTRLNSSHVAISYAVFCLKKKKESYSDIWCKKKKKQRNAVA